MRFYFFNFPIYSYFVFALQVRRVGRVEYCGGEIPFEIADLATI